MPETVFGPRVKFYASETGNLVAPFTVSHQHHCSPGDTGGKEPACQYQWRRRKRSTFHLWVGKTPWRRKWQPTPVFLPGKITWTEKPGRLQSIGRKASDTTEVTQHARRCDDGIVHFKGYLEMQAEIFMHELYSPEYSLEGLMLKLKLQYFGHLMGRSDSLGKT